MHAIVHEHVYYVCVHIIGLLEVGREHNCCVVIVYAAVYSKVDVHPNSTVQCRAL